MFLSHVSYQANTPPRSGGRRATYRFHNRASCCHAILHRRRGRLARPSCLCHKFCSSANCPHNTCHRANSICRGLLFSPSCTLLRSGYRRPRFRHLARVSSHPSRFRNSGFHRCERKCRFRRPCRRATLLHLVCSGSSTDITVCMRELSVAAGLVVPPVTFVMSTVGPFLYPETVSQVSDLRDEIVITHSPS